MLIAINTSTLTENLLDFNNSFLLEFLTQITQQHHQHQFIFIFNEAYSKHLVFNKNVTPIIIKSSLKTKLAASYWYNILLPLALKKYKANILIQTNEICSSNVNIPQILFLQNDSKTVTKNNLYRAKKVITPTIFSKQQLVEKHQLDANKIKVLYSASNNFKPKDIDIKQQTKDGYADGREYFLFFGGVKPNNNLMQVLKAFSMFKKWQYSSMKLLVEGNLIYKNEDLAVKLKTYKYRDDVVLLGNISTAKIATITASAYCSIYIPTYDGYTQQIFAAMQSAVPVITLNNTSMQEIGGNAALYTNTIEPEDIAAQMQLIYKDENLRTNQIKQGLEQATTFSLKKSIDTFWNVIEDV